MTNFFAAGIDVTNKCTLRCLHCFNSSGGLKNQRMDEMSDEELERMAYDVIDCRPVSICMCGGEPLLRKESIYKIANYSKNTCVDVNMVTNGELMTKEIAKKLWQSGISSIQVSLDGSTEEVVDWLRNKKGAYKNAINAIKYLDDTRQELGINRKISVSFIPHKKNFEQLEEVLYLCETLNVDSFRAQPLMLLGRAMDNLNTYKLNYKEYQIVAQKISKKNSENQSMGKKMDLIWGDPIDHLLNDDIDHGKFTQISANGDILISAYIPIAIGNIKKHKFGEYVNKNWEEVWNHRLFAYLRNKMVSPEKMNLGGIEGMPELGYGKILFDILEPEWSQEMDKFYLKLISEERKNER